METVRWLLSAVLTAGFVGLAIFNWRAFWTHGVVERSEPQAIPLVAGLLGVAAMFTYPLANSESLWWVPLVVDFGCMPYVMWLAFAAARKHA